MQRPRTQMAWTSHLAHLSTRNYKRKVWPNKDAIFHQNKAKDHNIVFSLNETPCKSSENQNRKSSFGWDIKDLSSKHENDTGSVFCQIFAYRFFFSFHSSPHGY